MQSFEKSWSAGFHNSLSRRVVTMVANSKVVKGIFSRLLGLQQSRNINIDDVLQHEVAPVSTSMFDDKGGLRIAAGRSDLRNKIQVDIYLLGLLLNQILPPLMAAQFYGLFIGQEMEQFKTLHKK